MMHLNTSGNGKVFVVGVSFGLLLGVVWKFLLQDSSDDRRNSFSSKSRPHDIIATETTLHRKKPCNSLKKSGVRAPKTIEICLDDITSAIEAKAGNTSAVELCVNRIEGGVTPSIGFVEECVELFQGTDVEVHVLVRPRPGGFVYTQQEFDVILRDILTAKAAGVSGVVVGILLPDGNIDIERMRIVRKISEGIQLTFHRAFDVCAEADNALETVIELGCDRLLTSAQCGSAADGLSYMRKIVTRAAGRIRIIAASGVSAENVSRIILNSGVDGVHAGSSVVETRQEVSEPVTVFQHCKHVSVGLVGQNALETVVCVSRSKVQRLVENARLAWGILSQREAPTTPRASKRESGPTTGPAGQEASSSSAKTASSANFLGSFGFNRKFRGDDFVNSGMNAQVIANIVAAGGTLRDFGDTPPDTRGSISRSGSTNPLDREEEFSDMGLRVEQEDEDILSASPTPRSWNRRLSMRRSITEEGAPSLVVHATSPSISVDSSYVRVNIKSEK